ncbi:Hpt domain-containing protein [Bdellovibrio bacteriovorus]|uniref:Hpt domain-containing protein n=1 Tax=Bdellovibrio bacteriovorus TaxID=959 RepID=UPI003AA8E365
MAAMIVPVESKVKYLRRRDAELESLLRISTGPELFELGKKVGHQIKGNAATFEFNDLTELGKRLEAACLAEDGQAVQSVVQELKQQVTALLEQYS